MKKNQNPLIILKKIAFLNLKNIFWYVGLCLSSVLVASFGVIWSESFRRMVSGAIRSDIGKVQIGFYLAISVFILDSMTQLISFYMSGKFDNKTIVNFQKKVIGKLLKGKYQEITKKDSNFYINVINGFVPQVQVAANKRFRDLIGLIITVVFTVTYLMTISPALTLGIFLISIVFPLLTNLFSKKLREKNKEIQQESLQKDSFLQDVTQAPVEIRMFNLNQYFSDKLSKINDSLFRKTNKLFIFQSSINQINTVANYACILFILGFGGHQVYLGLIDIGDIVAFLYSSIRIFNPLPMIVSLWSNLQADLVKAKEVFDVLEMEQEEKKESCKDKNIDIEFQDVYFEYTQSKAVLNNISLNIRKNKITAIVGPNGSGKSTLIKLLLGLYKPITGKILFNKSNIDDFNTREIISYVPQHQYIFSGTIKENILIANPEATDDELIKAIEASSLNNFLETHNRGVDFVLEEKGKNISGGEKQRINIARALLKDSPILIFDEHTSQIDNYNEKNIFNQLKTIAEHKTVIFIAHKLSTIENSDEIIFIDNGKVEETGSFDDLIKMRKGFYTYIKNNLGYQKGDA